MNYEILFAKLLRLPCKKAVELYEPVLKEEKLYFAEMNNISNLVMEKVATRKMIKEEVFEEVMLALGFMAHAKNNLADKFLEEVKSYPMIVWMEIIGELDDEQIKNVLKNYASKLPPLIIETLIINLSESKQAVAVNKYKSLLDPENELFNTFYLCLSEDAKKEIDKHFPTAININPILELHDLGPEDYKNIIIKNYENYKVVPMDDIIEDVLLNIGSSTHTSEYIFDILERYQNRLHEISDMRFKLLVGRLKYILNDEKGSYNDDNNCMEIFNKLKSRFKLLGLKETLTLLNAKVDRYYNSKRGSTIIYDFLDIAYIDEELEPFVNEDTIRTLIEKFTNECKNKTYTIDDFRDLVQKTTTQKPHKLIRDDYIEAIIACRQLMKNHIISDSNEDFLLLRERFIKMINDQVIKDGTCTEEINLNGLFYRLVKGNIGFDKVFNTKTYKGLIYLTKAGQVFNNPDHITTHLSDEQVRKLDITPLLGLKKELTKEVKRKFIENNPVEEFDQTTAVDYITERMMLQLLCYFGENRARHIIKSGMKPGRMENIFDNINYTEIEIDENGKPIVNEDLMEFLFGRGYVGEKNSVMNKIISEELMEFGRLIPDICNDYEEIKKACHGVITVKRATAYFDKTNLPVELKPNEYNYKGALKEMRTLDEDKLRKGIELCNSARQREYSSIPKVKGKLGDFTYEILDLKDPLALAVGYLSHCCFIVDGESNSALDHSMKSKNGRTLVVYYKGNFLAQSWIWRNGDVVCFDSVEAGSTRHGAYNDDISLVDIYKTVAEEIKDISSECELEQERVKCVTVGASDYKFEKLKPVEGPVPKPLERDVYVYDSYKQKILAGEMPSQPNYKEVSVQYRDPRKRVHKFLSLKDADIDDLDEALLKLQSIKYTATGSEDVEDITKINQLFVGQDWYITADKNGKINAEIIDNDPEAIKECKMYAEILGVTFEDEFKISNDSEKLSKDEVVKKLQKTVVKDRRG